MIAALCAAPAVHGARPGDGSAAARPFTAGSDGDGQPFLRAEPTALAKAALRERRDAPSPASRFPPVVAPEALTDTPPRAGGPAWSMGDGAGVADPLPSSRCPRGPPASPAR